MMDKDTKAAFLEEKRVFDRKASRHYCHRCNTMTRSVHKFIAKFSTAAGILPHSFWLCQSCFDGTWAYLSEVRDADWIAKRPQREAEDEERRRKRAEVMAGLSGRQAALKAQLAPRQATVRETLAALAKARRESAAGSNPETTPVDANPTPKPKRSRPKKNTLEG